MLAGDAVGDEERQVGGDRLREMLGPGVLGELGVEEVARDVAQEPVGPVGREGEPLFADVEGTLAADVRGQDEYRVRAQPIGGLGEGVGKAGQRGLA